MKKSPLVFALATLASLASAVGTSEAQFAVTYDFENGTDRSLAVVVGGGVTAGNFLLTDTINDGGGSADVGLSHRKRVRSLRRNRRKYAPRAGR